MSSERQRKSSIDPGELLIRQEDAARVVDSLIGEHAEYFNDPVVRINFIKDQGAEGMLKIAKHINARLRGETPRILRNNPEEVGGYLPMLHTPHADVKTAAFMRGFDAIGEYMENTDDDAKAQVQKVSLAVEALIVWVHPFNDGNGRTSRFLGEIIENGAADKDRLIDAAADKRNRPPTYLRKKLETRESALAVANDDYIMLDDDEREQIRLEAGKLPDDVEGMYRSVKRLIRESFHAQIGRGEGRSESVEAA